MLIEFLQNENTLAVLVAISLVILAVVTQLSSTKFMKSTSQKVLSPLNSVDSIQKELIESTLIDKSLKVVTLKNQFLICSQIKDYYKGLATSYYVNYYAFSICSILFTTLLAIAAFLIANEGWQFSSLVLQSFFLTTIVLSSIYYFLPIVLNNKENLRNNMEKVKIISKIQFDILSFSNRINQVDKIEIDNSINSFYDRISTNLEFLTTIDDSKLNNDVSDLLKSIKTK